MQKIQAFLIALVTLTVGTIVIVALVMANKTNEKDRFSVSGSGTVYAKADIANVSVGFKTETRKNAVEASKESIEKMNKIVDEIKKLGIEEKDIKTSNYNLNPVHNWTEGRGQELIGYEVSQNLDLKIRDLNKIGDVIAKTTQEGANQIGNIAFTIDDEYVLRNQARELAIEKAKEKAAMIARQSGMKLGAIKNVSENLDSPVYATYSNAKMDLAAGGKESLPAPEIKAGQNEIKMEVTLTYDVK